MHHIYVTYKQNGNYAKKIRNNCALNISLINASYFVLLTGIDIGIVLMIFILIWLIACNQHTVHTPTSDVKGGQQNCFKIEKKKMVCCRLRW